MVLKRSSQIVTKSLSRPNSSWSWAETVRQAWGLFVFSSLFAILFNLLYSSGIELKIKPPKQLHLQEIIKSQPSSGTSDYTGWNKTSNKHPRAMSTPKPAAPDTIPRLSLSGMKGRFDQKGAIFLDARKPDEYKDGHIPGALNFYGNELDKFAPVIVPKLTNKNQEIITYCHGGDCDLSLQVAKTLIETGYTRVEIFDGGWPDWKKAEYPVQLGETP